MPGLVTAVAALNDLEPNKVATMARLLRQAGYFGETKRGMGAPVVGYREAAVLVIGVNAARRTTDVVEEIPQFWALPRRLARVRKPQTEPAMKRLLERKLFGEAFESLLTDLPEFGRYEVQVTIGRPRAYAEIKLQDPDGGADGLFSLVFGLEKAEHLRPCDGRRTDHRTFEVLGPEYLSSLHQVIGSRS